LRNFHKRFSGLSNVGLFVLCKNGINVIYSQSAVNFTVNGKNGSKTAGTDATSCFDGVLSVGRGAADSNAKLFGNCVDNVTGTLYVASGTKANCDCILTVGIELELCVEGNDTEDFFKRNTGLQGNDFLNFVRQVAVDLLCLLENGHHSALFTGVLFDNGKKLFFLLFCSVKIDRSQFLFHNFKPPEIIYVGTNGTKTIIFNLFVLFT
jgi:hypothetical protein